MLHWRSKGVVRGFFIAYGLLLLVAAVVLSGAGHGPFIVFRLVGAPLTAWNRFPGIGILAIWALLGELLVRGRRWLAGGLLAAHYVGVLVVLFGVEGQRTGLALFRDTLRDAPEFVIPMFGVYAAGQVVVWTLIVQDGAWAQHDRVGGTLETGGGTT